MCPDAVVKNYWYGKKIKFYPYLLMDFMSSREYVQKPLSYLIYIAF